MSSARNDLSSLGKYLAESPAASRIALHHSLSQKHPNRVFLVILVEVGQHKSLTQPRNGDLCDEITVMKFSVEPTLTVGQLMLLIRRRLDVEPEIGLFVYSLDRDTKAQRCPSTSDEVSSLHADSEDGFIYGSVHAEVALGGGGSGFSILVCCTLTPIAITAIVLLLVGSFISPDSSGTLCTGLVNGSCSAFYSVCDSDQVEVVPRPEFGQRLCPIPMRCCAPVAISAAAAVPLFVDSHRQPFNVVYPIPFDNERDTQRSWEWSV